MATHNDFGEKGEELAAGWLSGKGFTILQRNWRQGRYEVDIIALRKQILHFVEVKARSTGTYGHPEETVTRKKIRNMMRAAAAFLYQNPGWKRIQYDVLAISRRNCRETDPKKKTGAENEGDLEYEYFFIEDVYL
jgi:putative endonuclease